MSRRNNNQNQNQVKNRAPAPIQISTEQILREAADRQQDHILEPIVKVHDQEEYQAHLADRRKHFEDNIRYRREHVGNWVKYARFEEDNKELERARSIFERALEVEHRSGELWLRYADFELRQEFLNHARNVLDRAVQILPRIDFLWYKYVYVEELVGDIPKCRAVFERWMKWKPHDLPWLAFARFETKHGAPDRAEQVMRQYVNAYPGVTSFCRFAKWAEFEATQIELARTVFERALTELDPEDIQEQGARLFKQFSSFEERQGEYERARVIYQHAISLLHLTPTGDTDQDQEEDLELTKQERQKRKELYDAYIVFEKKHGNKQGIETVITQKQREQYQKRLEANPFDYDGWLEWAAMEQEYEKQCSDTQTTQQRERVRETFERAVSHVPPYPDEKDPWRRYIYVWIYYAVYEELTCQDGDRAAQVYQACLSMIPHDKFTFAKIWIQAAKVHVRLKQVDKARKLLGRAIGTLSKHTPQKTAKIFTEYIALELALGEVDRCRSLYTQYLKVLPAQSSAWTDYATLEQNVGETDRCRALLELAIQQESLDMPEQVWKHYIDFEIAEQEHAKARNLYSRLLEMTGHVKVWISYAQFEANTPDVLEESAADEPLATTGLERARAIMEKAYNQLKQEGLTEERVLLLDSWRVLEKTHGSPASVAKVEERLPRRIKRKRMRRDEQGNEEGWEEYFDYQFPDDIDADAATAKSQARLLEMAAQWKKKQKLEESDDDDSDDDDDDSDDE
ncbi:Crooked neck-like protein 1 [Seminavis robusta]|uniref:Crooked neck-like protein 1 n=1 Tax=Seminavis robusta TaxID=568900 RepID=A0A9N8HHZ0_9STRA|nr:Crooked neck-like protein 1 [Seminavis robusta]|eukprot:Sro472_g149910.1 Crooked neck-like protein 1 (742) ;mRNA; f:24752-26977